MPVLFLWPIIWGLILISTLIVAKLPNKEDLDRLSITRSIPNEGPYFRVGQSGLEFVGDIKDPFFAFEKFSCFGVPIPGNFYFGEFR